MVIISYKLYQYCFTNMDRITKETCPIPIIILAMFIPYINIIVGIIMYIIFTKEYPTIKYSTIDIINKIFRIKA